MRARHVAVALLVLVGSAAGCTGAQRGDPQATGSPTPAPTPTPTIELPTFGPPGVEEGEIDPCLLTEAQVAEIVEVELPIAGASGGELFALCTYGGEEADLIVPGTVDIALVDLRRVSEESEEEVRGDDYIAELERGVGTGTATPLEGFGDGDAVLLTYQFGSQAWAWVGYNVYGTYITDLADADAAAEAVLRAVLDTVDSD